MTRLTVGLDPATSTELTIRAQAHKTSKAAFIRAAITGARPGGTRGEVAAAADTWWDTLPPTRRAGIHAWITAAHKNPHGIDPAQLDMLGLLLEDGSDG